jgi:hypothetical protein
MSTSWCRTRGLFTDYTSHRFWPGHQLIAQGTAVANPDAHYIVTQSIICFSYAADCRLAGEVVYHGADMTIRECPLEELITVEEAREKLLPRIKSVEAIALK